MTPGSDCDDTRREVWEKTGVIGEHWMEKGVIGERLGFMGKEGKRFVCLFV